MLRRAVVTAALTLGLASGAYAAEITGTAGDDVLAGGPEDDAISGLLGNDRLAGGAGEDSLVGGPGSDDLAGGPGADVVAYPDHDGVHVTVDDLANDGAAGELDNVQTDIEDVYGSPGADRLEGTAGPNTIDAGAGDDVLLGGAGEDHLFGGDGADRIEARDGIADAIDCGAGADGAVVDQSDSTVGCEAVERQATVAPADATVRHFWFVYRNHTLVRELVVLDAAPASARIEVRCRGRGCPYRARRLRARGRRRVNALDKRLKRAKLKPGVRIEVRIVARGRGGKVVRFTVQDGAIPGRARMCLRRGSKRPRASCGATPSAA
jgi:RTX calcium-binding nonapeptide repeat (4 copies)